MTTPSQSSPSGSPRRIYPAQWQLAVEVLTHVLGGGGTADRLLQHEFRQRRQMGGRDRAVVSDLVYGVLRDLRRLRRIAGDGVADCCAALALEGGQTDPAGLLRLGVLDAEALTQRLASFDPASLSAAERCNVPDGIYATWCASLGDAQAEQLGMALRAQAPVDLRVNTLRATPEQALAALREAGLDGERLSLVPDGLRLHKRAALQNLAAFRDGWIEPQDQGSQLLALLVAAKPGETVADYCAGAGGKTLALAARMQDRGELWAMDSDATRLERLAPRLQRAGISCVRTYCLDDAAIADLLAEKRGRFDAVLVDAPCSGSGTWRRQPEARLKVLDLDALAALQLQILTQAAQLVRSGGRLIYGTCSLLPVENQAVVGAFLSAHPDFERADASAILGAAGVSVSGTDLQLYPHVHDTDGFFGVCLTRR